MCNVSGAYARWVSAGVYAWNGRLEASKPRQAYAPLTLHIILYIIQRFIHTLFYIQFTNTLILYITSLFIINFKGLFSL